MDNFYFFIGLAGFLLVMLIRVFDFIILIKIYESGEISNNTKGSIHIFIIAFFKAFPVNLLSSVIYDFKGSDKTSRLVKIHNFTIVASAAVIILTALSSIIYFS